jgi:hypothetical protein
MGILDSFKGAFKKKGQQPQLPPEPPKPPFRDSSSPQELMPPPKIIDFDEEIPDLPELDIPEELGGNELPALDSAPHPKSGVVPPPQGHPEEQDLEIGGEAPEAEEESDSIRFNKLEPHSFKHVESEEPVEANPSFSNIKYHEGGDLFINEDSFAEFVRNLNEVAETVEKSPHYKRLLEVDSQKQDAITDFKTEIGVVFEALEQIDSLTFK